MASDCAAHPGTLGNAGLLVQPEDPAAMAEKVVQIVADELDPDANIIWGTQIQEELQNTIRTTIVVAGVKSPYIFGIHSGEPEYIEERHKEKVPESSLEEFIDGVF